MNRLKEIRETAGLTQTELARRAGVGRTTIINLETQKQNVRAQTETLFKIAQILNTPVNDIFFAESV